MTVGGDPLKKTISRLRSNALGAICIVVLSFAVAPLLFIAGSAPLPFALWFLLVGSGLVTLAFSAHLLFDAALFRLLASYGDEIIGGKAVDDILARMKLRPRPAITRSTAERIAGSRGIIIRQRIALAAFLMLFLALYMQH